MLDLIKTQLQNASNWQDRVRYLIQASKNLSVPSAEQLGEMEEIPACEAKLWWQTLEVNGNLNFRAYSEARIMNGILWLVLTEANSLSPLERVNFSCEDFLTNIGVWQFLSSTRQHGLNLIQQRIRNI